MGELIREQFKKSGMSISIFSDRICRTRQAVYNIFERPSIHTDLLIVISKVLKFDFFGVLIPKKDEGELCTQMVHKSELELKQKEIERLEMEVEYLKQIKELMQVQLDTKTKQSKYESKK